MSQLTRLVTRCTPLLHRWLLALTLLLAAAVSNASTDPLAGIDEQVERVMAELQIPGAALGVIVDGKVILARGYGRREVGSASRVTADTVFSIASMSKSFTSAVLATLVEEGKLDWDRPVRQYLPQFEMYDPAVTQQLTARDLLTHRTGMPRHDFLRFSTHLQPAELVARLRYLPPNRPFRDGYQYSNIMYAVAGYVAGEVAGTNWNELVRVRLFEPLAMHNSTTSVTESLRRADHAIPHLREQGKVRTIPFYDHMKFGVAPGGAIGSSANDMLKYLQLYLN
ncbi:serine hydrolase domain-containing protein, partial [Steroidobacter sp.]|uniref:serine hydrolase domain-containing protein n=1 Tax=Steroidobacter sp. TaxID=1978227 RepID=UPI001A589B8C